MVPVPVHYLHERKMSRNNSQTKAPFCERRKENYMFAVKTLKARVVALYSLASESFLLDPGFAAVSVGLATFSGSE